VSGTGANQITRVLLITVQPKILMINNILYLRKNIIKNQAHFIWKLGQLSWYCDMTIFLVHYALIHMASGLLGCVTRCVVLHISEDHVAFIFKGRQSKITDCP
jgi:hypothetical protein